MACVLRKNITQHQMSSHCRPGSIVSVFKCVHFYSSSGSLIGFQDYSTWICSSGGSTLGRTPPPGMGFLLSGFLKEIGGESSSRTSCSSGWSRVCVCVSGWSRVCVCVCVCVSQDGAVCVCVCVCVSGWSRVCVCMCVCTRTHAATCITFAIAP